MNSKTMLSKRYWQFLFVAIVAALLGAFFNATIDLGAQLHDIFCLTHGSLFA